MTKLIGTRAGTVHSCMQPERSVPGCRGNFVPQRRPCSCTSRTKTAGVAALLNRCAQRDDVFGVSGIPSAALKEAASLFD